MVYLTRNFEFCFAPLPQSALSAEENQRVFGQMHNPHVRATKYTLEVTIAVRTDPITGMVLDLKQLTEIPIAKSRNAWITAF